MSTAVVFQFRRRQRITAGAVAAGGGLLVLLSACSKSASSSGDADSRPTVDATAGSASASTASGGESGAGGGNSGSEPGAGGLAQDPSEKAFEPPDVPNVPLSGAGSLTLFASTLQSGATGLELYAGIRNESEVPLCSAAMQVEFYDQADQLIHTASAGVQSGRLYRFPDGSMTISCVAPGQTAMAAITDLPESLVLEELKSVGHRFPAFQIDGAVPVDWVTVSELEAFDAAGGTAFRGTVVNTSDAPLNEPAVSVFSVNGVGRPLGVATSTAVVELPPGGSWAFETNAVAERGAGQVAFAAASFPVSR